MGKGLGGGRKGIGRGGKFGWMEGIINRMGWKECLKGGKEWILR